MKKFFSVGALALALIMGMSSCSKEKGNTPDTPESNLDTYVGVRIAFPGATGTRVLPEDYNPNGEWKGRDKIEKITIYLVNKTKGQIDFATFNEGSFNLAIDATGMLTPTLAVRATSGEVVDAYAVINDLNDKTSALKSYSVTEFDEKFKALEIEVANSQDVAKYESTKDIVMMTNAKNAASITVAPNVTAQQAKDGTANRANIEVSRVVSRAIVTKATGLNTAIKVTDSNKKEISTITVTDIKYAVGQSNRKFFNVQKPDFSTPNPVYGYVPANEDWKANNATYFDYSDLATPQELQAIASKDNANVQTALNAETFSKFVLPITHEDGKYKKGNITYFEITCKFTVDNVYGAGDVATAGTADQDVYLGMSDGKFYSSRELAEAKGQQATMYKGGVMKYVIWLNPNGGYGEDKITKSPTFRNQVYHAHIKGFKEIGVPNNPLNPNDPNPDPKNPDNPIDPNDDPESEKTYLSVSITVLPWTIHSYEVDLSNRY